MAIGPDRGEGRAQSSAPSDSAPSGQGGTRDLTRRVTSAALLAPIVLACTYAGGWIFLALCTIAAAVVLWEWTSLAAGRGELRVLAPGFLALLAAALLLGFNMPGVSLGVVASGVVLIGLVAAAWPGLPPHRLALSWTAGGLVYAGALLLGPAVLRADPQWGLIALLFVLATVWATDIFAFFCGRTIGGPLLWQQISPKKTWSGAAGGLCGGLAAGVAVAYASGIGKLGIIGVMALLLSVVAQAGDLFESAVKRHFGVKDTSGLIPGHGGLMDRIDGFLFAGAAALLIGILRAGTDAPAYGLLVW